MLLPEDNFFVRVDIIKQWVDLSGSCARQQTWPPWIPLLQPLDVFQGNNDVDDDDNGAADDDDDDAIDQATQEEEEEEAPT